MANAAAQIRQTKTKPLVVGNKIFKSASDYELSKEDIERARIELGETEEVRNTCLQKLKEKMAKDNIKFRTDDAYLLRFLRCAKFNCEKAYEKILFIHKNRKQYPEVFCTLPTNFEELLNRNIFVYFPFRDEEGSVIFMDRFGKWDVNELTPYNLLQLFQPINDVITMNPTCQINKIIGIIDCKDTYLRQFTAVLNPATIWQLFSVWQNMYPWRIKYVILLNCNKFVYAGLNTVRYLIKKKIADRLVLIGSDMSKLHKYVNPAILPKEYGGLLEDNECSITEHTMNNIDYIKYELSFSNT